MTDQKPDGMPRRLRGSSALLIAALAGLLVSVPATYWAYHGHGRIIALAVVSVAVLSLLGIGLNERRHGRLAGVAPKAPETGGLGV
jgi:hypothetical protein